MISNGPFTRMQWLRRRMYRDYPRDLRPSTLATTAIVDASTGPLAAGQVAVAELRTRQPWALPEGSHP